MVKSSMTSLGFYDKPKPPQMAQRKMYNKQKCHDGHACFGNICLSGSHFGNVTIVKIHINQDRTCADMLMRFNGDPYGLKGKFSFFFRTFEKRSFFLLRDVPKICNLHTLSFSISCPILMALLPSTLFPTPKVKMSPKLNANFYGQSCLNRQSHKT